MSLPPREIIPVEQMDSAVRPYFIHHRNQVGINTSLMDLFRLIDLFLRQDEGAREPLQALRIISDYIQRKQIVAPMPSELVNFYDDPHMAAESVATGQNPLAELSRLLAPLTGSMAYPPSTTQQRQEPQSMPAFHIGANSLSNEREPIFHVPLGMPSPSRPARVDLALAFGDMPVPQLHQEQAPPLRATSTMAATDHRGALIVDVIREKLRAWLHRPDTGALKRWVQKKRHKLQMDDSWQFVNAHTADAWSADGHWAGAQEMEGNAETRTTSVASFERVPDNFPHGGVQITQDITMLRDSLPSDRRRSIQTSMARPLPPAPSESESHEESRDSLEPPLANSQATAPPVPVSDSRTRRNSSATPFPGSTSIPKSVPTVVSPPRSRRASLREKAASALFAMKSDSSSTDASLQAHLQAQLYSARFVAGISTPRPVLAFQPISTPLNGTSTARKTESTSPVHKRVLPPQIRLETGKNPDIPAIMIQPPSRPQTLSTPSVVIPPNPVNSSSSSSDLVYQGASGASHGSPDAEAFSHNTTQHFGRIHDAENASPIQRRGSRGISAAPHNQEINNNQKRGHAPENDQDETGTLPLDSEGEEYQSTTHSVHHGLPTPKSVENRTKLPLTSPVASFHDNTITPHDLQALGFTEAGSSIPGHFQREPFDSKADSYNTGPEGRAAPLVSRFSLDSHFTVSSRSTQGRSASPGSEFHSFSEATSHEGEFLAQLASRRKRSIRSGASRPTKRTPSLLMSQHTVSEEGVMMHHSSKTPAHVKERNGSTVHGAGESSRSPRATHRRLFTH